MPGGGRAAEPDAREGCHGATPFAETRNLRDRMRDQFFESFAAQSWSASPSREEPDPDPRRRGEIVTPKSDKSTERARDLPSNLPRRGIDRGCSSRLRPVYMRTYETPRPCEMYTRMK
jgi:hypothetical protein